MEVEVEVEVEVFRGGLDERVFSLPLSLLSTNKGGKAFSLEAAFLRSGRS